MRAIFTAFRGWSTRHLDRIYLAALAPACVTLGVMVVLGVGQTPPWLSALGALGALVAGACDRETPSRVPPSALSPRRPS